MKALLKIKKYWWIGVLAVVLVSTGIIAYQIGSEPQETFGAPTTTYQVSLMPVTSSTYEIGTSTRSWLSMTSDRFCLTSGECATSTFGTGGGTGTGTPGGSDQQIQYNNGGTFDGLDFGTEGYVLMSSGTGKLAEWVATNTLGFAASVTSSDIIHNNTTGIEGGGTLHSSQLTETTSTPEFAGLTLTDFTGLLLASSGVISTTTDNSTNWDTAYGWGNHADAGYLSSESDPLWLASSTEYARLAQPNTFTNTTTMASGTATWWDVDVLAINGNDRSQYFIDAAGTLGQLWMSDGSGAGAWANTSTLGLQYTDIGGLGTMAVETATDYLTIASSTATYLTISEAGNTYLPLSLADAAGDLIVANGDNSFTRLADGTIGQLLQTDGAGNITWVSTSTLGFSGSGTPGGDDTQIQFNDSGSFGGTTSLVWDDTNQTLIATGTIDIYGNLSINGNDRSQYFIDAAGSAGQVWASDGSGAGGWINTSTWGLLSVVDAASTYLTMASSSATYLTIASSSATYLTMASSSATYLTIASSTATYLTITDAGTTYVAKSIFDAKGDLLSASADDTPAILSVGTDGYILMASSSESTGLVWVDPADYFIEKPAVPDSTSTLVIDTNGTVSTYTLATSTVYRISVQNPTTTPNNNILEAPDLLSKNAVITQISGINISTSSPSYAVKLWYSTDVSGNSASTTIGTYVFNNTTTPDIYQITPTTVPLESFILFSITDSSSTVANALNVNVGGYYE